MVDSVLCEQKMAKIIAPADVSGSRAAFIVETRSASGLPPTMTTIYGGPVRVTPNFFLFCHVLCQISAGREVDIGSHPNRANTPQPSKRTARGAMQGRVVPTKREHTHRILLLSPLAPYRGPFELTWYISYP